jgi:ribonuclease P protein component
MKVISIKKDRQFRLVYSRGESVSNALLALYVLKNREGAARLGVSVSKKVGNSVVRNKVRRRVREGFREIYRRVKPGRHIVIVARKSAAGAAYADLRRALWNLLNRKGLLDE